MDDGRIVQVGSTCVEAMTRDSHHVLVAPDSFIRDGKFVKVSLVCLTTTPSGKKVNIGTL